LELFDLCSISCVVSRHLRLALALLAALLAQPALAACSDPPGQDVVWRRCLLDGRNLAGADLSRAVLRDTSLQRAQLSGARLVGIDGFSARFVSADLTEADLTDASLRDADLTRAVLRGARLKGADLRGARLFRADLSQADLTGAQLAGADFTNAVLDGARWTDGERVCAVGSVGSCH
jgi:uncharacterized protein YjbI with pentapeptide repeats